uniref:Uncharacterized protein n=1 Tax=Biomphalaria glabrata TaxID=6526 RepID=A0A2C9JPF4_BIOGL
MDRYFGAFRESPPERDNYANDKSGVRRNLEKMFNFELHQRNDDLDLIDLDLSLEKDRRSSDGNFNSIFGEDRVVSVEDDEIESRLRSRMYDSYQSFGEKYSSWRLEDSILRDSEDYTLKGSDGNPEKIPARIRDIITQNLSTKELSGPLPTMASSVSVSSLQEENRLLSHELNRLEDLLSASRAERDELGIKYNALSERVSNIQHKFIS